MKEKCNKFEDPFIFSDTDNVECCVQNCPDYKIEKENFDKVTSLIKKAKPFYFREKRAKKSAIAAVFLFLSILAGTFAAVNFQPFLDTVKYGEVLCAEDYGFPVDAYGLIMVNE